MPKRQDENFQKILSQKADALFTLHSMSRPSGSLKPITVLLSEIREQRKKADEMPDKGAIQRAHRQTVLNSAQELEEALIWDLGHRMLDTFLFLETYQEKLTPAQRRKLFGEQK